MCSDEECLQPSHVWFCWTNSKVNLFDPAGGCALWHLVQCSRCALRCSVNQEKIPFFVRDQVSLSPSGPVTVPMTKVVFALSGWAEVHSPSNRVHLREGSILTIPPALKCHGYPAGHIRTVTLYISSEYLDSQLKWLPVAHPLVHQLRRTRHERQVLQQLHLGPSAIRHLTPHLARLAQLSVAATSDFGVLSLASEVFDAVGSLSGASKGPTSSRKSVPRKEVIIAVELLRANLSRPWRITELAREIAVSPAHLTRIFRDQLGISPAAYLRQARADRMAELLATTDLTVRDAGAAAGWRDPSIASRSFKRRYGVAPRAFARSYRSSFMTEL